MKDQEPRAFFQQQMRAVLEEHRSDEDEVWEALAKREPSDEEILQILTTATASDQWPKAGFASPVEALATLSETDRDVICKEFRRLLKSVGQYH
jgi:hypothetical protein